MENFIDISNRLKTVLSITMDKELAELLGISKYSFAERKKRNSFPVKELEALAGKRPDLNLDVEYILTGYSLAKEQRELEFYEMMKNVRKEQEKKLNLLKNDETFDIELPPTPSNANTKILLNNDEMMLISCYRKSSDENKKKIFDIAKMAKALWLAELKLSELKEK